MTVNPSALRLDTTWQSAKREYKLIQRYVDLTPKYREILYAALSSEDKRIIRQACE